MLALNSVVVLLFIYTITYLYLFTSLGPGLVVGSWFDSVSE